jgi:hypothetical protein
MDSPAPLPEQREQRARGLDARPRLRLFSIALWTSFLGAALTTVAMLALLPTDALPRAGWAEVSIGFLCAWALALIPVTLALMLVVPRHDAPHGR